MNRILSLLLACAVGLSLLSGCSAGQTSAGSSSPEYIPSCDGFPAAPPSLLWNPESDLIEPEFNTGSLPTMPVNSFGLELLKQARTANGERAMESEWDHVPFSTLVSPLSVFLSLSLLSNGADENTQAQLLDVLAGGATIDDLNANCSDFMSEYQGLRGSSQCRIANSLWINFGSGLQDQFVAQCRGVYSAQAYSAELSDPRTVDDINNWVFDKTGGLISQLIDQPFDPDTALVLANALYLKNQWTVEFDPLSTHEMVFHHVGGSDGRVEYLQHFDMELPYIRGEGVQGVVLPYDDGRLAFFALLPDEPSGLGDWLNTLDGDALDQLLNSREDTMFLRLALPKFEAQWKGDLADILSALGLEDAFDPAKANFSQLGNDPNGYYIGQVVHAAKIEINEKGTEAAAATAVPMEPTSMPPEEKKEGVTLILDRPFLYGIVDLYTNLPLFLGTYE